MPRELARDARIQIGVVSSEVAPRCLSAEGRGFGAGITRALSLGPTTLAGSHGCTARDALHECSCSIEGRCVPGAEGAICRRVGVHIEGGLSRLHVLRHLFGRQQPVQRSRIDASQPRVFAPKRGAASKHAQKSLKCEKAGVCRLAGAVNPLALRWGGSVPAPTTTLVQAQLAQEEKFHLAEPA